MKNALVKALDALAERVRQSRAALIRGAIDDDFERHHRDQVDDGFGQSGQRQVDGLAYQETVRREGSPRSSAPDAVIWATAQTGGRLLVTRNTKDVPPDDPGVREPYTL